MKLISASNLHVPLILLLGVIWSCCAELRLLMSVFRHGNRYPESYEKMKQIYPRTPYVDSMWLPHHPAELTEPGKQRAFDLGRLLRKKYGSFLGPKYSKDLFTFRSSHPERCIVSTELVGAGLFPPNNRHSSNWQPVHVQSYPHENNTLFYGLVDCENYVKLFRATELTDPTIIKYNYRMRDFCDYASNHTGGPVDGSVLSQLNAEFIAVVDVGAELPRWAQPIFYDGQLSDAEIQQLIFASWTDGLKRMTGGVWLKEWFAHVDAYLTANDVISKERNKGDDRVKEKASFYGGHDLNIAGILLTLGIYYPHVPSYSSAINFELHDDDDGRFYVKVLHRDTGNFKTYIVPGCNDTLCPLETFRSIFANLIPANETAQCGRHLNLQIGAIKDE